jgi:hypothetical protein
MKGIAVRKTIALAMCFSYIFFTGYALLTGKQVPVEFISIAGPIIGYYFGKSTALEQPKMIQDTSSVRKDTEE